MAKSRNASPTLSQLKTRSFVDFLRFVPDWMYGALGPLYLKSISENQCLQARDAADETTEFLLELVNEDFLPVTAMATARGTEPLRTSCDCEGYGDGPCRHQYILLFFLWAAFHPHDIPWRIGASTRGRIAEAAEQLRFQLALIEENRFRTAPLVESLLLCLDRWMTLNPKDRDRALVNLRTRHFSEVIDGCPPLQVNRLGFRPALPWLSTYEIPEPLLRHRDRPHLASGIAEMLQFRFSDGTTLNASEILYHPLVNQLPAKLRPLRFNRLPELARMDLTLDGPSPARSTGDSVEGIFVSVLKNALERKLPVYLVDGRNSTLSRGALRIRALSFDRRLHLATWRAYLPSQAGPDFPKERGLVCLRHEPVQDSKGKLVFRGFTLAPSRGELTFHNTQAAFQRVQSLVANLGGGASQSSDHELRLQGHESRRLIGQALNSRLREEELPEIQLEIPVPELLQENERVPELHLDRNTLSFGFAVSFENHGKRWRGWNLPRHAHPVVSLLRLGLAFGTGVNPTHIATSRKGTKRDRDLKVLKHLGIASLLVLELSSYLLGRKTADGRTLESENEFHAHLDLTLGQALARIEARGFPVEEKPPSLSVVCSRNVMALIRSWCQLILDERRTGGDDSCELLFEDRALRWTGAGELSWHVIHALIRGLASESGGKCFEKSRMSAFEEMIPTPQDGPGSFSPLLQEEDEAASLAAGARYTLSAPWFKSPRSVLRVLLPLRDAGFRIFLDGKLLEPLADQDLQARIRFAEGSTAPLGDEPRRLDWFELHPSLFFRGVEIDPENLSRWREEGVLEHQGRLYFISERNLPSIRRLETFWGKLRNAGSKSAGGGGAASHVQLPRSEILDLLALRASGARFEGNPDFEEICRFYDGLGHPRKLQPLPATLRIDLKEYQRTGVQWLLDLHRLRLGAILADDMGLGKTPQTLCFLEVLRSEGRMGHVLVVVPTSLTYNWRSEAEKFAPGLPLHVFQPREKRAVAELLAAHPQQVLVCTYGMLAEHPEFFQLFKWSVLVFDEAQNLKNLTALRTQAARGLEARFKLCLTGTPLENHAGEFFSLMDLVVPGCLGEHGAFRNLYVNPTVVRPEDIRALKLKAMPLVLRRTKGEILTELPAKSETTLKLPFERRQEKIYRDIALSYNEKIRSLIMQRGESRSQLEMLTALLRLRQACSDPGGLPNVRYAPDPPKVLLLRQALTEILETGESALVFTQFLKTFDRIQESLRASGLPVFSMHGGNSPQDRERALSGFQKHQGGAVLLMTLKTGGVGLNLVKASYVFHIEPWWNPAVENQATDRTHRIGQNRHVQVYRYLMKDSVEEKIEQLKMRKQASFDALFSDGETGISKMKTGMLSQADFEFLIR